MEETLNLHTADGVTVSLHIAGIGSRSYAFLIDLHIRVLLALAWLFGTGLLLPQASELLLSENADLLEPSVLLVLLPTVVIYVFYHPILEVLMKGRTPGKRLAGLRIVTTNGETPDIGPLLIRNLFRLIDSLPICYLLGLGVVVGTARQVRIGDLAAGTLLVYEEKGPKLEPALFQSERLRPPDLEFLLDLLERWPGLEVSVRQRLGMRFLQRTGEEALPRDIISDKDLHARLSTLLKECHEIGQT